ncbi:MAG TPA: peptidyl-tRNA hydrolase Pth2 [Nitrososphaerales archaeon]|nr:peptidyl-tRNA hydrolase Pth2 [Nitrososphaerales archaeon]
MKQAIVVRTDLKMGKGKVAAQVAHASLSAADAARERKAGWYEDWKDGGQAKIVLRVESEEALNELFRKARSAGLPASLVEDRGLTQVEPGSVTCLGIGPGPDAAIDEITGKLRLL